ncbi:hypothetical protein GEO21_21840 [Sphingobacterium faecium]|uniref:hypothetical protein n=1 Tax=Sphingobacterium faecium TaxID=34087 RepID=UPI00129231E1|nr:hypothetical protein [Sphingobacterium faecium]MQP30129.1 hypothetical protein [Sphingobacterium faecium]
MKNILLIGPEFFGYTDRIEQKLLERNNVEKLITFYPKGIIDRINKEEGLKSYYEKVVINSNFDQVIVINGKYISSEFLDRLRQKNLKAKFSLYIWDDFKNANHSDLFLNRFDQIFTYSKHDSEKYSNLIYQPFFYSDFDYKIKQKDISLSFVGSLHSNRLKIYKKISNLMTGDKYLYLYSDIINFFKNSKNWPLLFNVKFKSLPYSDYIDILSRSKISIEIPHVNQKNITTRAIEVLGSKTKLITTSLNIQECDFYKEANIFILKDNNYDSIEDWSKIPYEELDPIILDKYSIDTWCKILTQ